MVFAAITLVGHQIFPWANELLAQQVYFCSMRRCCKYRSSYEKQTTAMKHFGSFIA